MEKPTVVIHFFNGDVLKHYGIPGMRWGFRKRKDYEKYKSRIKELKVKHKIERKTYIDSYKKNTQSFFKEIKEKGILKTLLNRVNNMDKLTNALDAVDDKYLTKEIMADKRIPIKLRQFYTRNKNKNFKKYLMASSTVSSGIQVATSAGIGANGLMYMPGDLIMVY